MNAEREKKKETAVDLEWTIRQGREAMDRKNGKCTKKKIGMGEHVKEEEWMGR